MNDDIYWDRDLDKCQFEVKLYGENMPPVELKKPFKELHIY